MRSYFKYPLLLSLLGLLLAFWVIQLHQNAPKITLKHTSAQTDDLHINELNIQIFDIHGEETYALKTATIKYISAEDRYDLDLPVLTLTPKDKPRWEIVADQATLSAQTQRIFLQHHVRLKHAPFQNHAAGIIETEQLIFYPKKNYAMTTTPIRWQQEQNTVLSEGMKAYLDQHRIELFHVKALYEPTI